MRGLDLDGCLIHQHDGDVVLHQIDPVALRALQALRVLAVVEGLLAGGTNQNFQQVFGDHVHHCTERQWSVASGQ